jgi:ribokinase
MKKILVIGSANMDMVVKSPKIPRVGETVLGGVFAQHEGGKGANQAMAAKTLYEDTLFCAGMGDDSISRDYLAYLQSRGMDTSLIKIFQGEHTGVALITVGKEGQNIITVAPGANLKLSPADMQSIDFSQFSHVAFQLETDIDTVEEGLKLAKKAGCTTILTPAPAKLLPDEILKNVDWLVPNEIEILQVQRGFTSMKTAAESLLSKGVGNVIVTLGERGCALFNSDGEQRFSTFSVRPIDTVGAGDCFTGAFMAGLKMFDKVDQAITFANAAASLKVTKVGAQSYATQKEVLKLMKTK